jgi:hypothetical protein
MSSTNGNKIDKDNYPTPDVHVKRLLEELLPYPDDIFLEPCKGVTENIYSKVNLPEKQKLWAELDLGVDYLATDFGKVDLIITNPPFSLTEEFLRKSFSELKEDGTLCYLQRVNFLGSIKRVKFWNEIGFPEKAPVLIPRPRFVDGGSDSCEYCWFIWDYGSRFPHMPKGFSHLVINKGK